jgi:hypothetical protein
MNYIIQVKEEYEKNATKIPGINRSEYYFNDSIIFKGFKKFYY